MFDFYLVKTNFFFAFKLFTTILLWIIIILLIYFNIIPLKGQYKSLGTPTTSVLIACYNIIVIMHILMVTCINIAVISALITHGGLWVKVYNDYDIDKNSTLMYFAVKYFILFIAINK